MAVLPLLRFPDERLRRVAVPVEKVDDEIRTLIDDMIETMYAERGIGLAAPQVNVSKRIVVIDVSENRDQPIALINPEIISTEDEVMDMMDGCLSIPDSFAPTERYRFLKVRALDRNGDEIELEASDLFAGCIQHELDHLDGKLFIDHLSPLKRQRIEKKQKKLSKLIDSQVA
ncbi:MULTISPECIES: peptide deformylase [Proteus]|uniref:Peptide deformylase n=1 Tax=Proteus penneri TaxID=102862 RepID=A0A0G4QFX4_9GAMM|nr:MULTISPECIES: peptide deformylase [Proteus]EEG86538.1 peptide deformylase [Proteus penneri ATCC 35198]MBJ2118430.1 peptide deformylase [Proteus penneri]MCO8051116.1 peptide deformylase [Proteus penneri]MCX2587762.1 peptide deformylase [Proteus penneri]NBL77296.1 peptide deformylase [Proteus sp. G2672]